MIDRGTYHGLLTLVALAGFVAITLWAWSSRRKAEFERAARAALDEPASRAATDDPDRGDAR